MLLGDLRRHLNSLFLWIDIGDYDSPTARPYEALCVLGKWNLCNDVTFPSPLSPSTHRSLGSSTALILLH